MERPQAEIRSAEELRLFLAPGQRSGRVRVTCDGTSSLGHVVESLGVPLTEVGSLAVGGRPATPGYRPGGGEVVEVSAVCRPQRLPSARFILDVHLGTVARRLRLVGVDAAYANDLDDDTLIERANEGRRALLTKDRGLLRRRKLWLGAYVRGAGPDEQFRDVLDRFARRWRRGPGALRATGCLRRLARPTSRRRCGPAPGAPIRASRAVRNAARSTGVARTAGGLT